VALSLRILHAADRVAVPWKNGGGLTREVAVHPPGSGLAGFEWRVSMAEVRAGGPFSSFPDIDRSLAVLEGSLTLTIDGRAPATLFPDTPAVQFPGDVPVSAAPPDAVVTDLNVMVRRGRWRARMNRHAVPDFASLPLEEGSAVILALTPLVVSSGAIDHELVRLDAMLLDGPATCEVRSAGATGALWLIEITALTPR
jgi:uncharacterized protein